jgi:hypothetical protein
MAKAISNVVIATDTFAQWIATTNEMADTFTNYALTANSSANGAQVTGNSAIIGIFTANTLSAVTAIRGGTVANSANLNITSNAIFSGALLKTTANTWLEVANAYINSTVTTITGGQLTSTSNAYINNSNTFVNATSTTIQGGALALTSNLSVTVANITINATSMTIRQGSLLVNSSVSVTNTFSVNGNITIEGATHLFAGNVGFDTDTLYIDASNSRVGINNSTPDADLTITGTANVSGNTEIGGNLIVRGTGVVNGALTVNNTAALGNTTITGFANISSTLNVTGAATVNGVLTVNNTAALGNTTITGFANISSTLAAGNTTITGFANISSTLAAGDTTITGFANISSTLASGNTTITGFANVSSTLNVIGATTVNGALTVNNTAALGNTTITGFANISSTLNVTGAATVNGALTVNNTGSFSDTLTIKTDVVFDTVANTNIGNANTTGVFNPVNILISTKPFTYKSAKITASISSLDSANVQTQEMVVAFSNTANDVSLTVYGTISAPTSANLGIFSTSINSTASALRFTQTGANSSVKLFIQYIK